MEADQRGAPASAEFSVVRRSGHSWIASSTLGGALVTWISSTGCLPRNTRNSLSANWRPTEVVPAKSRTNGSDLGAHDAIRFACPRGAGSASKNRATSSVTMPEFSHVPASMFRNILPPGKVGWDDRRKPAGAVDPADQFWSSRFPVLLLCALPENNRFSRLSIILYIQFQPG